MLSNCSTFDRFTTHLLAGLVVTILIAFGSLTYAVAHIQATA